MVHQFCHDLFSQTQSITDLSSGGHVVNDDEVDGENKIAFREKFKKNNHIFNLSHGILPKTKISNIEKVIKVVRDYETSK